MDSETASRISRLAKTLKDLHVVASHEEAFQQARDIIGGNESDEKSIGQLFREHGLAKGDTEQALDEIETLKEEQEKEKVDELELQRELKAIEQEILAHEKELQSAEQHAHNAQEALQKLQKHPAEQHYDEPEEALYEGGIEPKEDSTSTESQSSD